MPKTTGPRGFRSTCPSPWMRRGSSKPWLDSSAIRTSTEVDCRCLPAARTSVRIELSMRRTVVVLALLASATTSSARATQAPSPGPSRPPVEIDAVFVDKHGAPVRDISRNEVEVWIAGRRIPLDTFIAVTSDDAERSRRSIVLLLDDITLEPALAPRVREAGRHLVQRLQPGDQMAVIALSGDATKST